MDAHWLKQYVTGASDYAETTDERWQQYAEMVGRGVTRKKEEAIEAAMKVIESSVNGDDKDLLIEAMRKVHPYLFNEIITASIQTVKNYHMHDGRIAGMYKKMAEEHFI